MSTFLSKCRKAQKEYQAIRMEQNRRAMYRRVAKETKARLAKEQATVRSFIVA